MNHADLETALAAEDLDLGYRDDPIASHVEAIMAHLGEDVQRPGLVQTPRRFAAAMRFLAGGYEADLETVVGSGVFHAEGRRLVLVRDVVFHSLCEHHLLPLFGRVHVGYLPGGKIIGLSKIPRIIDLYARRFQVQERLTEQVADALVQVLAPRGVLVVAQAQHMCMAMRGVQKQRAATATRAMRGLFLRDRHARQEVLSMLRTSASAG
jgi:GTP cyclohydrolase I